MVDYRILGTLEVASNGTLVELGPPKQRALLAILLLNAGEIVPVDRLIDLLWPDGAPRQAAHAIQVYVSELRHALEPVTGSDVITWRPPGYVLTVDPESIDVRRLERLVGEGRRQFKHGELVAATETLTDARRLWHGSPLADFAYEEFAQPEVRRFTELWLSATETLAAAELDLGRDEEVVALAAAASEADPLRERPRELQMRALYRTGRHADALRAYEAYRQTLLDELGVEPSPALRQLQEQILVHDTALGGDAHRAVVPSLPAGRNPYKGLRAFGEDDAVDFFGRSSLIERLVTELSGRARLLALVGPSGSGKSSVLGAGLVPGLRSGERQGSRPWKVTQMRPGSRPFEALEAALRPLVAAPGASLSELLRDGVDGLVQAADLVTQDAGRLVLIIDQFEELFLAAEPAAANQFLDALAGAAAQSADHLRIVLALRADAYDRPLLHSRFAPLFLEGVVNILPMRPSELEEAVVEPARRVGVAIDPALVAELVAAVVDRPGALPLLQHTLAELFDRRSSNVLTLAEYRQVGGIDSSLSRRAEEVFAQLDDECQSAAQQVFLRSVRLVDGGRAVPRRVPIRELTALGIDPVALSDALTGFDRGRLITFDRDPISGDATMEVAHEALFSEWARLAGWLDERRADLGRHAAFAARAADWEAGGRAPDDLLVGSRLDEHEAWSRSTSLQLTTAERAFLDASLERRSNEQAELTAIAARQRRLERNGRLRLGGLIIAATLFVATVTYGLLAWPGSPPGVVLLYPGPGDGGVSDSVEAGFDAAVERLELDAQRVIERYEDVEDRLVRLSGQGVGLIVVGSASNPAVERVARAHPDRRYLAIEYIGELPNVATPRFEWQEGAFLAGAAAALASETSTIGVVAELDDPGTWPFVAGFEAGAREVRPDVEVLVTYVATPPPYPVVTFGTVNRDVEAQYHAGADVILYARDWVGETVGEFALFEAAASESKGLGRQLWAIGVDSDWQVAMPIIASQAGFEAFAWDDHILTSLITRYDLAIDRMLDDYTNVGFRAGSRSFGLADGAFELSYSGGFIDAFGPALDELEARIVAGEIVVPEFPENRGPPR